MIETKTDHWQTLYQTKSPTDVSWFRPQLEVSLELMSLAGLNEKSRVIALCAGRIADRTAHHARESLAAVRLRFAEKGQAQLVTRVSSLRHSPRENRPHAH